LLDQLGLPRSSRPPGAPASTSSFRSCAGSATT
jgi:hypothetical protein